MLEFREGRMYIDKPKRPKKLTGTRLAGVLGVDRWNTPFKVWCDVTRTYKEPFEGNKYTKAGETIEPKTIDYLKNIYLLNVLTPEDKYGKNFFKKTWGDFFPHEEIFGGMWDSLVIDENGKVEKVIEIKTTERVEDWESDVPEHYALQASLYAYLLGVDDVIMVASFLEDKDYDDPSSFEPNAENTIVREFKVSERYPNFDKMIDQARAWYLGHVTLGVSPKYNEKDDKEILDILRCNVVETDDIGEIVKELEQLTDEVKEIEDQLKPKEDRIKLLKDHLKDYAKTQFRPYDTKVQLKGSKYNWNVSRSIRTKVNKKAMKKDGILSKYEITQETYRLTNSTLD